MFEATYYDCVIGLINHSNPELIIKCIASIIQETSKKYMITVVNNSSDTRSEQLILHTFPNVNIISNKNVSGFAENMNLLLRMYSKEAKYFLILNDDTVITEGAIDKLIEYMEQNKNIGALSPRLIFPNGTPQLSAGIFNMKKELWRYSGLGTLLSPEVRTLLGKIFKKIGTDKSNFMKYLKSFYEKNDPWTANYISGTCMLIRKKAIVNVGLLSEDYFMYAEDVDWCKRANMKGWMVGVLPKAVVMHVQNKSMNLKSFVERERSSLIFFSKYYDYKFCLVLYRMIIIFLSFGRLTLLPLIRMKYISRKELVYGYFAIIKIMLKNEINCIKYNR